MHTLFSKEFGEKTQQLIAILPKQNKTKKTKTKKILSTKNGRSA